MAGAGTTIAPRLQMAATVALSLALSACVSSGAVGVAGPPGPPGPAGPAGPPASGPTRLVVQTMAANGPIAPNSDVVVATAPVVVTLPTASAAGAGRTVTIRNVAPRPASGPGPLPSTEVGIRVGAATDTIEGQAGISIGPNEMVTLVFDGVSRWIVISASDL